MKTLIVAIVLSAVTAFGFDAVDAWPKTVTVGGVTYYNPPASICVAAGKRLKPAVKPVAATGKQIKSETLVQDPDKPEMCKYVMEYEDAPKPAPAPEPEVLTNVPAAKCSFSFTTLGDFRAIEWLDAPKTNKVPK